jgi:predicted Ser/Thr protein kinase
MSFTEFLDKLIENPVDHLHTSSTIISNAIRHFGYKIVVRSGEPVISYNIFQDLFSDGINATFGHEFCIEKMLDVIESSDKESYSSRGIVLMGPPSSGKTNIIDIILKATEEYSKKNDVKIYSFHFCFPDDEGNEIKFQSSFNHNPLLLIPVSSKNGDEIVHPRNDVFNLIKERHGDDFYIPNFFKYATLDKNCLDILEEITRKRDISIFDAINEYVRVEEIDFGISQGKGIANIDDMKKLRVSTNPVRVSENYFKCLEKHLSGKKLFHYESAFVFSNRGALHIHDAFHGMTNDEYYRPLLMLLGSGKISVESTQTYLDTTVFITTNLEEMDQLEEQLTSNKLLDRIEKIPVNYLIDANAEVSILERDMNLVKSRYDLDPNLFRIASYFSVMTRLIPTAKESFPEEWSEEKKTLYSKITPEQKLFIYCCQSVDPVRAIENLPMWHPFRNEASRLGIDISNPDEYKDLIVNHPHGLTLEKTGLFTNDQLKFLDDEFMRTLIREHYPVEGKRGMSVRQLQNIMRAVVANSDGNKVTVNQLLARLKKVIEEGEDVHYWLGDETICTELTESLATDRAIGETYIPEGDGNYGIYNELLDVTTAIYHDIVRKEVTISVVDRDPDRIEKDLRKYLQFILLHRAMQNNAFHERMVDRYSFIDESTGAKVDRPDSRFMDSIEKIINPNSDSDSNSIQEFRNSMFDKFSRFSESGELKINSKKTVINSSNDNLRSCFEKEYSKLLSHKKVLGGMSTEDFVNAFFHKMNSKENYKKCDKKTKEMVESVISNMVNNYGYSKEMALETIVYALKESVVNFNEIIS